MYVQVNLIIFLVTFVLYLYFYPRSQNQKRNNYPSLKQIDKILIKYYERYFYKFSSKGDYPKLKYVYDEIRYYLSEEGISKDVLEVYIKSERMKNTNLLTSIFSFVLTFTGAKEFDKLLNIGKKLTGFYNQVQKVPFINSFINYLVTFWSDTSKLVFWGLVAIISFSFMLFLCRVASQGLAVKFSYNRQKYFIIKDILSSYEVDGVYQNHNLCYNLDYLDLYLTRTELGYNMLIPKQFRTDRTSLNYFFHWNMEKVIIPLKRDDNKLCCTFKMVGERWLLDRAIIEGEIVSGKDLYLLKLEDKEVSDKSLDDLKIVFEMLFKSADLMPLKKGIFERMSKRILKLFDGASKLKKIMYGVFVAILLVLSSFVFTSLIVILIGTGIFYLLIAGYLIWSISTWLLKNYY